MTEAPAPTPETGTAVGFALPENPGLVLLDAKRFDAFYEAVKDEVSKHVPDLTTAKGRDAIKSLAYKVTKTKTAIDAAGKTLKEEAQKTVTTVDAARRTIRERLEALAEEVRAPLTAWEDAEKARLAKVDTIFQNLTRDAVVTAEESAAEVQARLSFVMDEELDPEVLLDSLEEAQALKARTIETLKAAMERIQREEADRAELARLRAENEAREKAAAEAEAARIAAEKAEADRVQAEQAAAEAAKREEERLARVAKEAEDRAREAAEREAAEAQAAQQRAHDEALAAERRRADEAEAARKAQEAQALAAQQQAEREAAEKRRQDEARAADREHRAKIMGAAKVAIMGAGIGESHAVAIVRMIAAGEIPAVRIEF